jgi:hypothetical protein
MPSTLTVFAIELSKIAEEQSKRKKSYGAAVLATAPAALVQGAADYPKGWADKKVEVAVDKGLDAARRTSAWRTGAGRALGRSVAGVATAPLFFSGMKDIKDGEKKKGYAKVIGASGAYSVGKGGIEALVEAAKGTSKAKALKHVKDVAGIRGVLGTAGGVATAAGVARSSRKKKGEKDTAAKRFLVPAALGGGIGAAKGGLEALYLKGKKSTPRSVAAKASGRATSGVLGALAISEIARSLSKEKKANVAAVPPQAMPAMAPSASEIYTQVRDQARAEKTEELQRFLKGTADPEKTPARRAVTYAVNDELRSRNVPVPQEKLRDQVMPPQMVRGTNILHTAAAAAIIAAPGVVWSVGLADMKRGEKDKVLSDAMDRLIASEGIARVHAGSDWRARLRFDQIPQTFLVEYGPDDSPEAYIPGNSAEAVDARRKMKGGTRRFISAADDADPFDLAHELGHAKTSPLRAKTIGSAAAQSMGRAAKYAAVALPLLALDGASDKAFHTPAEIEAKARFAERVGLVTTLLAAPYLAEEVAASTKGMGYMARAGASPSRLLRGAALRYAPALATHAAPFATGAVAAKILRKRKRRSERKESST